MEKTPRLQIQVSDMADELGMRNILDLELDGSVKYHVQSNGNSPESREIGYYEGRLDEAALEKLYLMFESSEFNKMEDHFGKVLSGEPLRRIIVINNELVTTKMISFSRTPPIYYETVKSGIDSLIGVSKRNPAGVLNIGITWPGQKVRRDTVCSVQVTFSSRGSKSIVFANPFATKKNKTTKLYIRAQRSDIKIMDLRQYHYVNQNLQGNNLKSYDGNFTRENLENKLAPGSSVTFHLDVRFDWPPGKYTVQIVWEDTGAETDKKLFGVLYSSIHEITVEGASKTGDSTLEIDDGDNE
ncbi:MAG: hypothetical protein PHF56_15685 [Desulfuromonadaceae bacterium]|nr:hypothetical protein [Desulfuromonadaceae bacterium]